MSAQAVTRPTETSVPPHASGPDSPQPGWPPRLSPRMLVSLLPSAAANILAPPLAYTLVRPHVASSVIALAIAVAIPAAWTVGTFAWRRRVSRLGLASVALTGAALAVTYLTGGSPLAVELQDPAETGVIGLAFLVSVIARRPLFLVVMRLVARHNDQVARRLADPAIRRTAMVETVIIGAIFLTHALAITALALTLPTGTFLAVYRLVGLPIIAVGLIVLIWYRRRHRWMTDKTFTQTGGSGDEQPS
jgi:hypothetical protein